MRMQCKPARLMLALLVVAMIAAQASAAACVAVRVQLPDERSLDGAPLQVFARRGSGWEPLPCATVQRKTERSLRVMLPRGEYAIEIGASHPGGVTLLRDSSVNVSRRTDVTLRAMHIAVSTPIDGKAADIKQIAARRCGNGEVRWTEVQKDAVNVPDFVLSPGETYLLSACGESDKVLTAVWKSVVAGRVAPITFADEECKTGLSAVAEKETPALRECFVDIAYPDAFFRLSAALSGRRFRTNRARAMVSYTLTTQAGQKFTYTRKGMVMGPQTTLAVGRPPKAVLFVGGMWPEKREDATKLYTQVFLVDADGRPLDWNYSSSLDYQETIGLRQRNGSIAPLDRDAFTGKPVPSDAFAALVRFRYDTPQTISVRAGSGWVDRRTEHFDLNAPAVLDSRAQIYLQSLERVREILIRITGRPAPTLFPVFWKSNLNNIATSGIGRNNGSNDNIWMIYPYNYLQDCEPLREPAGLLVHEMLHSFGFEHGDEMSRLQAIGQAEFDVMRWQAVDSGTWAIWGD